MKRFVLFVVALSNAVAWAQVVHPDLKSGKEHVNRIVIMPVQAEIDKQSMKGGEPMTEQARELEKSLTPVIADVLRKMNVTVDDTAFASAAFDKDPDFRYTTDDLQKKFDAILGQLTRKPNDVRKGRFTLGDSVAKLGDLNADALLFVRASGSVLTGARKVWSFPLSYDRLRLRMALVDARTGTVLYFAKQTILKNVTKDPNNAKEDIQALFKDFGKANKGKTLIKPEGRQNVSWSIPIRETSLVAHVLTLFTSVEV